MSPAWSETERWMIRAIELARPHRTHPNPRVGCVIADAAGEVVGEGAHRGVGTDHAEQQALRQAGPAARGGVAVVSLEPCAHFGRTPPCADALVAAGIAKVVTATRDPDRRVGGRGLEILENAGIETSVGLFAHEAIALDPAYHHHRRTGRPYVRAVLTGGLDHSDSAIRSDVHTLEDGIDRMIAATDLTARDGGGGSPTNRLIGLGERGLIYVGVRDEELVARLHGADLIDAVTVYSDHPTLDDDPIWSSGGYHRVASRSVGSRYRIDLDRIGRLQARLVRRGAEASIPTRYGRFRAIGYESLADGRQHVALVRGTVAGTRDVLVRVHSECLTGDVFASLRCDCGSQLDEALRRIGEGGRGVVLYIRDHEGRGIGLIHKLAAYALQERGRDTVEANLDLGFPEDGRDYGVGARILSDLGVSTLRLLTNNPAKRAGIEENGLRIVERVPLVTGENEHNRSYLRTKVTKLGHLMDLQDRPPQK